MRAFDPDRYLNSRSFHATNATLARTEGSDQKPKNAKEHLDKVDVHS